MFTVMVTFNVQPDRMEEFLSGIRENARRSLHDEPGCLRFDVHLSHENEHEVLLYEIYRDEESFRVGHRESPHYAEWRKIVTRCVPEGGHTNTFATPAFPADIPEAEAR